MVFTRSAKLTIGIMAIMGILITYVETMVTPDWNMDIPKPAGLGSCSRTGTV